MAEGDFKQGDTLKYTQKCGKRKEFGVLEKPERAVWLHPKEEEEKETDEGGEVSSS